MENGKYRGRAREWDLGMTGTGKVQLAIAFDFLDHPGESMTAYLYFTDDTFDRTLKTLREMGWTGDDFENITGIDQKEVQLVVEAEADQNSEMRPRIKWINGGGGLALKQALEPNERKAFAAKMRDRIRAADAKAGRVPGQKPATGETWEGRPPV